MFARLLRKIRGERDEVAGIIHQGECVIGIEGELWHHDQGADTWTHIELEERE